MIRSDKIVYIILLILALIGLIVYFNADKLAGAEALCHVTYVHTWQDDTGWLRLATGTVEGEAVSYITGNANTWGLVSSESKLNTACTQAHAQITNLAIGTLNGAATWKAMPDATFEKDNAMSLMYANLLTYKTRTLVTISGAEAYHLEWYYRELQINGDWLNDWLVGVRESAHPTIIQIAHSFIGSHNTIYLPVVIGE